MSFRVDHLERVLNYPHIVSAAKRPHRVAQQILQRELGLRIVEQRERRGWNQSELARRLEIGRCRLGKWERGQNAPSLEELAALCGLLGTTLDELVLGRKPRTGPLPPGQRAELAMLLSSFNRHLRSLMKDEEEELPGVMEAPAKRTQRRS